MKQTDSKSAPTRPEEDLFHTILDSLSEGVALNELVFDGEGQVVDYRVLMVNPAFHKVADFDRSVNAVGALATQLYGMQSDVITAFYESHRSLSEPAVSEYQSPRSGRWFMVTASPIRSQRFVTTFFDLTDRKKNEAALLASESQFRSLFEKSATGYVMTGLDGKFLKVNQALADLLGYEVEELQKLSFLTLTHPEDAKASLDILERLGSGNEDSVRFEKRYLLKDGSWTWCDVHSAAVRDSAGKTLHYLTSIIDISARKFAEEAANRERELLQVTLGSLGEAVVTLDLEGHVETLNPMAERLTGWKAVEAQGQRYSEVVRLAPIPVRQGIPDQQLMVSRDGLPKAVIELRSTIRHASGDPLGTVVVLQDVTERLRVQEQLERSDRLESLGLLAGGIAHDFNNLLGGLFGYLELARIHSSGHPSISVRLEKALGVYHRAKALTQQLLTFAKGGQPVKTVVALGALLLEGTRFALSGSKVAVEFVIAPDLWFCEVDVNQIGQVIDNLVRNAVQSMGGQGRLTLWAKNHRRDSLVPQPLNAGSYVEVGISDNGPGIPAEILPRIFDPFYTTRTQGNGLGLSTVYSILRRHGGEVTAESMAGFGATFRFWLPATERVPAEPPLPVRATKPNRTGSGRILVMDDEEALRESIAESLKFLGYTPTTVPSGNDAIVSLKSALESGPPFRAALVDLTVPGGLGGLDLVPIFKDLSPELPLVVMSGYSEDAVLAAPTSFGFADGLIKPFLVENLAAVLNRLLG